MGLADDASAEQLARALRDPLRSQILHALVDHGDQSPTGLARRLGFPLSRISYHVRVLHRLRCVELVRTEPRRGVVEHFYRATARPYLSDEAWGRLSSRTRHELANDTLRRIFRTALGALKAGALDEPRVQIARVRLELDERGLSELSEAVTRWLDEVLALQDRCEGRAEPRRPFELSLLSIPDVTPTAPARAPRASRARRPSAAR